MPEILTFAASNFNKMHPIDFFTCLIGRTTPWMFIDIFYRSIYGPKDKVRDDVVGLQEKKIQPFHGAYQRNANHP